MILTIILASLAALSLALTIWQIVVAMRFPLYQCAVAPDFAPGITVLKPLKGCDSETAECLRSWLTQDYSGSVEVLFGVDSANDPVCKVARQVIAEHPECTAQLVICSEQLGSNAKVSKLVQLERLARYEVICVSDADVWAPPDFLASMIAPLRDSVVGLVNCIYRMAKPRTLAMRCEAFAVNADFWSQVLQSLSLRPMDFALGAAMLMPRPRLAAIGGFEALVDHLADDFQLGHRTALNGGRVELSPAVVECRSAPIGWVDVWLHQLRWARTIRVCRPGPYFLSILSNASLWPLLWFMAAPSISSLVGAGTCLSLRMAAGIYLEGKLNRGWKPSSAGLAVVKDLLQIGIWAVSFTGRQVNWRGEEFQVEAEGKLVRLVRQPLPISAASAKLQSEPD